jgi:predicted RNase H-like HicB family nuclease
MSQPRPTSRRRYDGLEFHRGSNMQRQLSVIYQEIEDGWIMAQVPELPGAVTQGRNLEEAREMIKEAVELLLETYRARAASAAPSDAFWETLTIDLPATA